MIEINLDDDGKAMDERKYSKLIGPKLLRRVVNELGNEVLVQFGFTKTLLNRMTRRGVMWWEIDLLSSILLAKDMFKQKYIKRWEWDLMKQVYPIYVDYFNLKPVLLLAMHPEATHANRYSPKTIANAEYEDIFWWDKKRRPFLDRTFIFDWMIYLICWLWKQYSKLGKQQVDELLARDPGTVHHKQPTPSGIFYDYFMGSVIDSNQKLCKVTIGKNDKWYHIIKELYQLVSWAFHKQMIGNIEDYVTVASGPKVKIHQNHCLVNFALHFKYKYMGINIPNIYLADLNGMSARLQEKKI